MRLLLAVSSDGFLARGAEDDMRWTGAFDKAVFRLLTLAESEDDVPVLVGTTTFHQLPRLPGRRVIQVSTRPTSTDSVTLAEAAELWPRAWIVGGPATATAALKLELISRAFISVSPSVLGEGISMESIAKLLPASGPAYVIPVGDALVRVYTEMQQWPGK